MWGTHHNPARPVDNSTFMAGPLVCKQMNTSINFKDFRITEREERYYYASMVSAELTTGNLFSKELMMIGGTTEQRERDNEVHTHSLD